MKLAEAGSTARVHYTGTLDANHPLAGKDLNFDIELLEVV